MIAIKRFSSRDADFGQRLDALLAFESAQDEAVDLAVADILAEVKARGDDAVIEYTRRFDRLNVQSMADLELARDELQQALDGLPSEQREALEVAACRVRSYHERQILHSWQYEEEAVSYTHLTLPTSDLV